MKILILSDLHIEREPFYPVDLEGRIDDDADVVVLAGDIHEGTAGIRWARETFPDKPIVYVAGNHEFYGHHWVMLLDQLREEALKHDVHYLEASGVDIGGVRFLGCTLWTDFCLFAADKQELVMRNIKSMMSDYDYIRSTPSPETYKWHAKKQLVPGLTLQRHMASRAWLEEKLGVERLGSGIDQNGGAKKGRARTVVVSHHAPSIQSIALYDRPDFSSAAYASNLEDLVPLADLWVHGHTHHSLNYLVHGKDHRVGTVRCNPRGYRTWKGWENAGFGKRCLVDV
ncbi:MAG: metallophosphoesterase [Pseudomonadota bacterium]